ncbi:hypothetical protein ROTAS13_03950 [Roseomonas sp. TAS13]|nr:hypothetical protein ROTAS13_03950 [Roseomonas sp. TAS13]
MPHGQVLVPPAQLHLRAGEGVVTVDNGGVERRHDGGMQEVEEVGDRRTEALDGFGVDLPYGGDNLQLGVAADAGVEQAAEGALVLRVLIDVGDAELRLPEEGVVRTLEDLPLLCDGVDHGLQGRSAVGDAKGPGLYLGHNLLDAAPDRAEVLDPLLPKKPAPVGGAGVVAPARQQGGHHIGRTRPRSSRVQEGCRDLHFFVPRPAETGGVFPCNDDPGEVYSQEGRQFRRSGVVRDGDLRCQHLGCTTPSPNSSTGHLADERSCGPGGRLRAGKH